MKTFIKILLLISIVVGALYLVTPSVKASGISVEEDKTSNCTLVAWHRNMICEYPPGQFTHYTGGYGEIVLVGDLLPSDEKWDGALFKLSGYLVNNGSCTMLLVESAEICE